MEGVQVDGRGLGGSGGRVGCGAEGGRRLAMFRGGRLSVCMRAAAGTLLDIGAWAGGYLVFFV